MASHNHSEQPPKKLSSRAFGQQREQQARTFLEKKGLLFITNNYQCKAGEIDLIMREQETLVFIEVRFRKDLDYGTSAESVVKRKQYRIIRTAQHYLQERDLIDKHYCRFDVIAITEKNGLEKLEWIKDAFWVKY